MPKTQRDLLHQLADQLGGEPAAHLRTALERKTPFDDLLDRPMTDEAFSSQLQQLTADFPKTLAHLKSSDWAKPATWGLPN